MNDILFLTQVLPYPLDAGPKVRGYHMLRRLAGRTHQVCTGVCVIFPDGGAKVFHNTTEVTFQSLDDDRIDAYFALVSPFDKAGAYGIQEHGELIVSGIRGSYENVMGLPVDMVVAALEPLPPDAGRAGAPTSA